MKARCFFRSALLLVTLSCPNQGRAEFRISPLVGSSLGAVGYYSALESQFTSLFDLLFPSWEGAHASVAGGAFLAWNEFAIQPEWRATAFTGGMGPNSVNSLKLPVYYLFRNSDRSELGIGLSASFPAAPSPLPNFSLAGLVRLPLAEDWKLGLTGDLGFQVNQELRFNLELGANLGWELSF